MSPREKPSEAKYAGAARRAEAIEQELRRIGRWRSEPLPESALEFEQAFGADTMSFEQWIQFVLLPRIRAIVSGKGDFPVRSQVGAYAVRALDGDDGAAGLVSLLSELDAFIEGTEAAAAAPAPAPPPAGDYASALARYREGEFVAEGTKIVKALKSEILFQVDWDSVAREAVTDVDRLKALRAFASRGVGDLRAAILLFRGTYGDAAGDALADSLLAIRLVNLPGGALPRVDFRRGVLSVESCLRTHPVRSLEIGKVLADALDVRVGPLVESLRTATIPEHEAQLREVFDVPIAIEVDFGSFRADPEPDRRVEALQYCAHEGVYALVYGLTAVGRTEGGRDLVRGRVTGIAIRHATDPAECGLWAEGSTVVLAQRLHTDQAGRLSALEVEERLPGILAGMPGPAADAGASLPEVRRVAAAAQARIAEALGAPATLDVDLAAIATDPAALTRVPRRALQRLAGAFLLCAPDFAQWTHASNPHTVRVRFVPSLEEVSCRLTGDVLDLAVCLFPGPGATAERPGFLYECEIAKVLRDDLGFETMPIVASHTDVAIPDIRARLREGLGAEVAVDVDWTGFLAHGDPVARKWAVDRLPQDGLEPLLYALTGLAETGEDFARLIRGRVRAIRVESVPAAARKCLLAQGNTLVLRIFLFEGWNGRLTIDELKKALPGVLAGMPAAGEAGRGPGGTAAPAPARWPDDPRLAILRSMIASAAKHLEGGRTQAFLLMFMPPERVAALWQDGGGAFRALLAEHEARREDWLAALRACLATAPETPAPGRAVFRFPDLAVPVVSFRESGARWLLEGL